MSAQSPPRHGESTEEHDFVHQIAVEMSRLLNTINPNDLLARRVIDIAKYNRTGDSFLKAVSAFGKFPEDTMLNMHSRILAHQSMLSHSSVNGAGHRRGSGHSPPRMLGANGAGGVKEEEMEGMDHDSTDTLAAEPRRKGGLVRTSDVSFR